MENCVTLLDVDSETHIASNENLLLLDNKIVAIPTSSESIIAIPFVATEKTCIESQPLQTLQATSSDEEQLNYILKIELLDQKISELENLLKVINCKIV